jgi:hypothetical protein
MGGVGKLGAHISPSPTQPRFSIGRGFFIRQLSYTGCNLSRLIPKLKVASDH